MKRIIGIVLSVLLFVPPVGAERKYAENSASVALTLDKELERKGVSCAWFFGAATVTSIWGSYELKRRAKHQEGQVSQAEQQFNTSSRWQDRLYWKAKTNELREDVKDSKALSVALIDIGATLFILTWYSASRDLKKRRERKLRMQITPEGYEMRLQKKF